MARNLKDAFYNAQFRVGQGIFTRAVSQGDNSLTESNFTGIDTFDTLIEDDTGALPEFVDSQISMSDAASNGVAMNKISASQTAINAVAASQTAMDAVAASQTAMDAVAASQTAMDAVAASQTARDVIGFSGLAYDTIAASNMAIGKYAIGYTTESPSDFADMDAVAASQTAMDAVISSQLALDTVVASQTAMDAVAASQTAMDVVLQSSIALGKLLLSSNINDSVWADNTGSEAFWDVNGDLADSQWGLDADSRHGGQSLFIDCDNIPSGGDFVTYTVDLTDASSLSVFEKTVDVRASNFEIIVGGTTLFSASNNNTTFEERNVDVSSFSGDTTIEIGLGDTDESGRETLVSDVSLS